MNNYEDKLLYLLSHQKHECPICKCWLGLSLPIDLHHRNHPEKWKRKKMPLFLNSILNLVALHTNCHAENRSYAKISDFNAEKRERFLECHKKCAIFVNMD